MRLKSTVLKTVMSTPQQVITNDLEDDLNSVELTLVRPTNLIKQVMLNSFWVTSLVGRRPLKIICKTTSIILKTILS